MLYCSLLKHAAPGINVCILLLLQHKDRENEGDHAKGVFYKFYLLQTSNCDFILFLQMHSVNACGV
jgi:hypothetical protein